MQEISSSQNPNFKSAVQLHSSRGRKKLGKYIIFGDRECRRAVHSKIEIDTVFICPELLSGKQIEFYSQHVQPSQILSLTNELMNKVEFGDRIEGVAMVARRPNTTLQKLQPPKASLTMVLESIEKPGNLGAILRTCDGAGVDTVIAANPMTDFFHHNCIRSSMGAVFSLQLGTGSCIEVMEFLNQHSYSNFTAIVGAKMDYQEADYTANRIALVFGNEAQGLSEVWRGESCNSIFIPMRGIGDSLNVSVTAAIVAYEAAGQRKQSSALDDPK